MFIELIFTHFNSGIYTFAQQITLSVLASLLSILVMLFCYAFFNSLRYIAINQDYIGFINAITKREVQYLFNDIASVEITGSRISDMLKLTLKSGRSKYIAVDMVTKEQLEIIYKIVNERISTT